MNKWVNNFAQTPKLINHWNHDPGLQNPVDSFQFKCSFPCFWECWRLMALNVAPPRESPRAPCTQELVDGGMQRLGPSSPSAGRLRRATPAPVLLRGRRPLCHCTQPGSSLCPGLSPSLCHSTQSPKASPLMPCTQISISACVSWGVQPDIWREVDSYWWWAGWEAFRWNPGAPAKGLPWIISRFQESRFFLLWSCRDEHSCIREARGRVPESSEEVRLILMPKIKRLLIL